MKNIDFINEDDIARLEDPENEKKSLKNELSLSDFPNGLYVLSLDYSKESFYATVNSGVTPKPGDYVIATSRYGDDMVRVTGKTTNPVGVKRQEVVLIKRLATERDINRYNENKQKVIDAGKVFREKVALNKLDMKLLKTHFLLEEPKVLFFFSADSRVDFRKLVKDLVAVFRIRVELRQVGVRDESRITGGIGPCGRVFCCHSVTDKLQPVSIKMAKDQSLSLNSLKISGQCGRLLCCLAYEHEWYSEELKKIPSQGSKIFFKDSVFKVIEVNLVAGTVFCADSNGRTVNIFASEIKKKNNKFIVDQMFDINP